MKIKLLVKFHFSLFLANEPHYYHCQKNQQCYRDIILKWKKNAVSKSIFFLFPANENELSPKEWTELSQYHIKIKIMLLVKFNFSLFPANEQHYY